MLAAIRPHSIDLAVLVHVAGAMVLVGGLVTAATATLVGWRDAGAALQRFSSMTLFAVALPGWIVMRIGAQWAASKEHLDNLPKDPTWLGIGFSIADIGGIVLLVALVLGGFGMRRARSGGGAAFLKASGAIAAVLVVAYLVAVWAMGAKPD